MRESAVHSDAQARARAVVAVRSASKSLGNAAGSFGLSTRGDDRTGADRIRRHRRDVGSEESASAEHQRAAVSVHAVRER
jgi:hypothetical protein